MAPDDASPGEGGLRWSAHPPPGYVDPGGDDLESRHVEGSVVRFMCDYGVDLPLWDEGGPLPNDPEWLGRELGLSLPLVEDLVAWAAAWAADWDSPGEADPARRAGWEAERPARVERARRLVERLRAEVPTRFTVADRETG